MAGRARRAKREMRRRLSFGFLIVGDDRPQALVTLTHDHKMAALPDARKL